MFLLLRLFASDLGWYSSLQATSDWIESCTGRQGLFYEKEIQEIPIIPMKGKYKDLLDKLEQEEEA